MPFLKSNMGDHEKFYIRGDGLLLKFFRIFLMLVLGITVCCAQSASNLDKVGAGKKDITSVVKGSAMMGYAKCCNIVEGLYNPIYSRAIVIEHNVSKQQLDRRKLMNRRSNCEHLNL